MCGPNALWRNAKKSDCDALLRELFTPVVVLKKV
jgi:hypothetical protein